jgi:Thioredoxin
MNISKELISTAYDYKAYRELIDRLYKEGKSTGPIQNDELLHYTELNNHRMNRVEKTSVLSDALKEQLSNIKSSQIWLVITEGWCGDGAQQVPVFHQIEKEYPQIKLKLILRDEHLAMMDQFLTNGSRSIPKLLIVDELSSNLLATWGPQPKEAVNLIKEMKEKLHLWYARNRGAALQSELTALLKDISN